MRKKKVKTKLKRFIIFLIVVILLVLVFFYYRNLRVKNIYVIGNSYLKEYEIIELSNLKDYPYLYNVSTKNIENVLKENPIINSVNVHKSLLGKITINIEENKVLYQNMDGEYTLSNNEKISLGKEVLGVPQLINSCDEVCEKLVNKLVLVDKNILNHISEIEYKPNDLDKERFMFYMSDGNYIYVTLSKLNVINSYNEIYPTLEGKKGILYLDSGNHFEIKNDNDNKE